MNQKEKEFMVQKIRTQYTERENTQLDALKALDKKVKKPANVFAVVFGSISAVVMGSGMSLVMTDIGSLIGYRGQKEGWKSRKFRLRFLRRGLLACFLCRLSA